MFGEMEKERPKKHCIYHAMFSKVLERRREYVVFMKYITKLASCEPCLSLLDTSLAEYFV
jgi:hypothetical protein